MAELHTAWAQAARVEAAARRAGDEAATAEVEVEAEAELRRRRRRQRRRDF